MMAAGKSEVESDTGGIFNWARDKRVWMHLTAFFMVSFVIHGAGFYLFKVVYPTPERAETNSGAITLLNPSDPGAREVLQRIEDRTVFLLPPSSRARVRIDLDESQVRFIPAFSRTELELQGPPATDPVWEKLDDSTLLNAPSNRVELKIDPALANRPVAPWTTIEDYFAMAEAFPGFRAQVDVSPAGKVTVERIESELEANEESELSEVIASTLRFLPAESTDRGWIEVQNPRG